jgi:ferredoxin--NADP+ reductase
MADSDTMDAEPVTRMVSPEDAKLLNGSIAHRFDISPELCIVRVLPDAGVPDFKPGQYATLGVAPPADSEHARKKGLARLVMRPYSISSTPLQRDLLEFYLALVPQGQFTPRLWDLHEADRLYVAPKCKGKFTLDNVPAETNLVMVATGTGIAPFVSMYRTYRETGRWRRFVLIHGTRLSRDLAYRAEMEQFAAKDPSLTYLPTCSREPDAAGRQGDWSGLRGRVNVPLEQSAFRQLAGIDLSPESCHVFLCGNPSMIDDLTAQLTARGFTPKDREHPDGNVHLEKYW